MRVRDHIAVSTGSAALLSPWLGGDAIGMWAGGVLVDADHYAWFCLTKRRGSAKAAMRFFNEAHPPQHAATRVLHTPSALIVALLASLRWPRLRSTALGMTLHLALDLAHDARMNRARTVALARDDSRCRHCGTRSGSIEAHIARQPSLLPSYRSHNLISLCGACHEAAHGG